MTIGPIGSEQVAGRRISSVYRRRAAELEAVSALVSTGRAGRRGAPLWGGGGAAGDEQPGRGCAQPRTMRCD